MSDNDIHLNANEFCGRDCCISKLFEVELKQSEAEKFLREHHELKGGSQK